MVSKLKNQSKIKRRPRSPVVIPMSRKADHTAWRLPECNKAWNIEPLIRYFNRVDLHGSLKIDGYYLITDLAVFVNSHIQVITANIGKPTFYPYLVRLAEIRRVLELREHNKQSLKI